MTSTRYRRYRTIAAGALLLCLTSCGNTSTPTFVSTDVTGAQFGTTFTLTDHNGSVRTLSDFKGKAVVLFFGYTHCPDICPATMAEIAGAMKKLGKQAERVQVLFVTLDPERDSPATLRQYLSAFDPAFLGLYGDDQATREIASEFKAFYQKQAGTSPSHHTVDHSTGIYIFDPLGKLRLYATKGNGGDSLARDIAELLRTTA